MDTQRAVTQLEQELESDRYRDRDTEVLRMEIRQKAGVFWGRIRRLSEQRRVSTWTLFKATGVPQSQLQLGIGDGQSYPTRHMVESLAEFFGVSEKSLLPWGTPENESRGEGRRKALAEHFRSLPRRVRWG